MTMAFLSSHAYAFIYYGLDILDELAQGGQELEQQDSELPIIEFDFTDRVGPIEIDVRAIMLNIVRFSSGANGVFRRCGQAYRGGLARRAVRRSAGDSVKAGTGANVAPAVFNIRRPIAPTCPGRR